MAIVGEWVLRASIMQCEVGQSRSGPLILKGCGPWSSSLHGEWGVGLSDHRWGSLGPRDWPMGERRVLDRFPDGYLSIRGHDISQISSDFLWRRPRRSTSSVGLDLKALATD